VILILLFFFRKYSLIAITEKNKLRIEALKRKKIIEITESKTRFFTNISHEIRTPLTLIFSPLERIFNHATLDDDTRASLKLVRKNVQRLLSLTDQLLQLRKLDVGIIEPQFENVSIVAYINDIIENFEQQAKRKAVTIKCSNNIENEEDCIWIDKEMITTALYNLLSNALKYSKGKGLIEVSLAKVNLSKNEFEKNNRKNIHADEYLKVEVSDNGIGIPSKDLNKIFHRFYQSEKASKAEHAGSGIGLSIVKGYIELHKGIIKATSKVSEGTIMKFYLPFGDKHFAASQKKEFKAIISKSNAHNIDCDIAEPVYINNNNIDNKQKSKLLIVDDDSDMLSFLSNHFSAKYNVKTATDGKKAWCLIQKEMPDIVISDIMMPEIEGTELCNLIKAEIETSHIPVILLTAKAGNDNIIEGYEKGADRYINKPFSLNVLEAQVAQLIATRRQLIDLYSKKITLKPRDITITSTDEKFMTRLMDIIEENLSDPEFDVTQMVEKMHMSHSSVLKKIKALTDTSLVDFVRRHRLNKAAMIFDKQKMPVSEVAYLVGFSDPKYFSKCFSKQFGKTPTEFLVKPVL
jgi:signal transduction histidine kinase/DNA-binding response OmpR family regulator